MQSPIRLFIQALTLLALLSGCKIAVIVGEGGGVTSAAEGTCFPNTTCVHDVLDTTYLASFTANPLPGWHFVEWKSGDDFICADSTLEKCTVNLIPLAGNPVVEAIVASNKTFYLMPVFTDELPITDTIMADGKEWAPIQLLKDVSWNQVNAVCPITSGGVCNGSLLGYDLDSWTWANVDDVNSLLNNYIGTPELGPGPDFHFAGLDTIYPAMLADGWITTEFDFVNGHSITGLIGEEVTPGISGRFGGVAQLLISSPQLDFASTGIGDVLVNDVTSTIGVYLYRNP